MKHYFINSTLTVNMSAEDKPKGWFSSDNKYHKKPFIAKTAYIEELKRLKEEIGLELERIENLDFKQDVFVMTSYGKATINK